MFGGSRLKRTCMSSNCSAIMSLAIHCDGQHTHAPWLVQQGVFDTSLEAEYTPALAKAMAECILEFLAFKLPSIQQFCKRLKLSVAFSSHCCSQTAFETSGYGTGPGVFSSDCVVQHSFANCLPVEGKHLTKCCCSNVGNQSFRIPCGCKLSRQTVEEGSVKILWWNAAIPSLQSIGDSDQHRRHDSGDLHCVKGCVERHQFPLQDLDTMDKCSDWVFGIVWTLEQFL